MLNLMKTDFTSKLVEELYLTNNFHVDICSVFPSRVSNHDRVDSLVLPLGPLDGEDTVALGGFDVDPAVSLCDDLRPEEPVQSYWTVHE